MTTLQIPQAISGPSVALDGRQGLEEIVWQEGLLEQVRSYVASTYVSRGGRGVDMGGVFFGSRHGDTLEVTEWRRIQRGKDATSHFYLAPKDEQALVKLLKSTSNDESLEGLEVVGWFRSRTKGEPELEEHDVQFHEKFFTDLSQFAMVIRPSHQRPALAALYVRNEHNEFERDQATVTLSLLPGPAASLDLDIESIHIAEPRKGFPWLAAMTLLVIGVLLTAGALYAMQWNTERSQPVKASDPIRFELAIDNDGLLASWDPTSDAVRDAENAQLLLGDEKLQLSHAELAQGFLRVPLKNAVASDLEVSLKVGSREEVAQLIVAPR